jgi:hypothetical protein
VAYPGVVSGSVNVFAETELMSLAPRFRFNLLCDNFTPDPCLGYGPYGACGAGMYMPSGGQRVDWTLGYRYMRLDERLRITEQLTSVTNGTSAGFDLADDIETENRFHGAELGLVWECYQGPWSCDMAWRFAFGSNRREVAINGNTISTGNGVTFSDVGGLLALPSNIGTYSDDQFVVLPEFAVNLGYQIAPSVRLLVGYTFLYWGDVARPGDQIDSRVNTDLLPPSLQTTAMAFPAFVLNDTNYWAQGLNFGIDWRW